MAESVSIKNNYTDFAAHTGVKFLQGLQSAVDTLIVNGGAQEGAFYLAKDSQRLYIGRKESGTNKIIPVAVNEGVVTVASASLLPNTANPGEFYYALSENILCVCIRVNGSGAERECVWTQLNTDSHLTTNSLAQTIAQNNSTANTAKVTTSLTDSGGNSSSANFAIVGSDNITVSFDNTNKTITISADDTTYDLSVTGDTSANTATVSLTDSDSASDSIIFQGGSVGTNDVISTAGDIKVTVIPGATADDPKTVLLSQRKTTGQSITARSGNNGGWNVAPKVDGIAVSDVATLDPIITYGATGDTSSVHFLSGTATLDVYSTTQADAAIAAAIAENNITINAMTFKGTLDSSSDIDAITEWRNGDTYKISTQINSYTGHGLSSQTLKVGDVLIVSGPEGSSGTIPSANATFNYIPSGDENSYTGSFSVGGNTIAGMRIMEGGISEIAGFELVQQANNNGLITISPSVSSNHNTISLGHATVTTTKTTDTAETQNHSFTRGTNANTATALSFYVPSDSGTDSFQVDGYGHLTTVTLKQITVQDTHNYIKTFAITAAAATGLNTGENGVATTHTLTHADGTASTAGSFTYVSKTLNLTAGTNAMNLDIEWGSF